MTPSDLFTTPRDFPDKVIRQSLEHPDNLRDFLRAVVPAIAARIDFARVQRLEREFTSADWRGREADLLFRAPYRADDEHELEILIEILVEHQSSPDASTPLRTLLYSSSSWEEHWKAWQESHQRGEPLRLPPVVPIVLYTGPRPWNAPRSLRDLVLGPEELVRLTPAWSPVYWELREQSVEALLDDLGAWMKMLAVVRAGGLDGDEFERVFAEALRRLEALALVDRLRWMDLARAVVAWGWHLRPTEELDHLKEVAVASQNEVLDRKEIESMFKSGYTATLEKGIQQGIDLGRKEGIDLGRKEGIDLGRKEGIDLGRVGTLQSNLLRLLEKQFGEPSEQLRRRVLGIHDATVLDSLFERALDAKSIKDFEILVPTPETETTSRPPRQPIPDSPPRE